MSLKLAKELWNISLDTKTEILDKKHSGIVENAKKVKFANFSQNFRSINFSDMQIINPNFQINPNINQFDKQGKKHGKWKGYHENTQSKRYEGEFNHGTPIGRFTYYAIEGHVSGIVDFINDSISSAQMFHDNGSIMAEGKFLNQTKSGKWYIYSRSGYLLNVLHYLTGALEGTQYSYYPKFDDYEKVKVMEQYE